MKKPTEIWISSLEALELWGIKKQTLYYYRDEGKIKCRPADCKDGSKTEVKVLSLPIEIQEKYFQLNKPSEEMVVSKAESSDYELDEEQNGIALAKAAFLRLYIDEANKAEHGKTKSIKENFINIFNTGNPHPELYKKIGRVNYKTIETWKREWLKADKDYRVLGRHKRPRKSTVTKEEADILLKYALIPNSPLLKEVADMAIKHMKMENFPNIKHYKTYVNWLNNFRDNNYSKWTLMREGEKALRDEVIPPIERDREKIGVGDVIIADGHVLNFTIINPYTGKYKRMNLLLFYDMKSNMPLGWEIDVTENTRSIAVALYRSIIRLGKYPKVVYIDNGRAFRSKYFNGSNLIDDGIIGLFERCNIKVQFAKPYNAKAKDIERFFKTFAKLERGMITYVGTSIDKKPPRTMRNEKMHNAIYEEMMKRTSITIHDAHVFIAEYFDEYAKTEQQSGNLKGIAPWDIFKLGVGLGVDKNQLIFLMMDEKDRPVTKKGINMFGTYYWCKELYDVRGTRTVRFDFLNKDEIYVYDDEKEIYFPATCRTKTHPAARLLGTEEDVAELKSQLVLQKELERETKLGARELLRSNILNGHNTVDQIIDVNKKKLEEKGEIKKIEEKPKRKRKGVFSKIDVEIEKDNTENNFFKKNVMEG